MENELGTRNFNEASFQLTTEKILSKRVLPERIVHAKFLWPEQDQPVKEHQEATVLQWREPTEVEMRSGKTTQGLVEEYR